MLVTKQATASITKTTMLQLEEEAEVCSSFNRRTRWKCRHKGQTLIDNSNGIIPLQQMIPETVKIRHAGGAQYAVQVRHKFSEEEVTSDRNPIDTMLIVRTKNGAGTKTRKEFKYADNSNIPTHLLKKNAVVVSEYENGTIDADLNGWINPAYNGEYFVDIVCDDDCNCSANKRKDSCKVVARLEPPKGVVDEYDDNLSVRKMDTLDSPCAFENKDGWYCSHYGDAKIVVTGPVEGDTFFTTRQAETVIIPNAIGLFQYNVATEVPNVKYPFEGYASELFITTNDETTYGPYKHYVAGATHSVTSYSMFCDENCKCEKPFPNPTIQH